MSERLEIIKFLRNSEKTVAPDMQPSELISRKDVDWLIERVEELEKENKELSGILQIERNAHDFNFELLEEAEEENKRYKEAIKEILNNYPIPNYDLISVNTLFEVHLICKQVLDEVENEQ